MLSRAGSAAEPLLQLLSSPAAGDLTLQPSPREALLAAAAAAAAVATSAVAPGEGVGSGAGAGAKQQQQQGGVGSWSNEQLRELVDAELRHWTAMVHLQVGA